MNNDNNDNVNLEKPFSIFSIGKIIYQINSQQYIVEYDNFLGEQDTVDASKVRLLSNKINKHNIMIKRISLNDLILEINKLNSINFNNKLSISSEILAELFNQRNNYLELLAIELVKQDLYILGSHDDIKFAFEVILLKLYSIVIYSH